MLNNLPKTMGKVWQQKFLPCLTCTLIHILVCSSRSILYIFKVNPLYPEILLSFINPINIINLWLLQFLTIYSTDFYITNRQYISSGTSFFLFFNFILAFHYYSTTINFFKMVLSSADAKFVILLIH